MKERDLKIAWEKDKWYLKFFYYENLDFCFKKSQT